MTGRLMHAMMILHTSPVAVAAAQVVATGIHVIPALLTDHIPLTGYVLAGGVVTALLKRVMMVLLTRLHVLHAARGTLVMVI